MRCNRSDCSRRNSPRPRKTPCGSILNTARHASKRWSTQLGHRLVGQHPSVHRQGHCQSSHRSRTQRTRPGAGPRASTQARPAPRPHCKEEPNTPPHQPSHHQRWQYPSAGPQGDGDRYRRPGEHGFGGRTGRSDSKQAEGTQTPTQRRRPGSETRQQRRLHPPRIH